MMPGKQGKPSFMRRVLIAALAVGTAGVALAQADVIAARRDGYKGMQAQMEAIQAVVQAGGDVRPLAERVRAILAFARTIPTRFPPGSDVGDTRAQPAVWTDRATFEQRAAALVAQVERLLTMAEGGDGRAFGEQFRTTAGACSACHRDFRRR